MTQRTGSPPPEYLTYNEAAEALRISRRTLMRYIDAGHLTPHRLPYGQPRLKRDDVYALLSPSDAA